MRPVQIRAAKIAQLEIANPDVVMDTRRGLGVHSAVLVVCMFHWAFFMGSATFIPAIQV